MNIPVDLSTVAIVTLVAFLSGAALAVWLRN